MCVDVIGWSGMLVGWFGFECDVVLCCGIEKVIGILVMMLVFVLNELFECIGVWWFGFVMLYFDDV